MRLLSPDECTWLGESFEVLKDLAHVRLVDGSDDKLNKLMLPILLCLGRELVQRKKETAATK